MENIYLPFVIYISSYTVIYYTLCTAISSARPALTKHKLVITVITNHSRFCGSSSAVALVLLLEKPFSGPFPFL